MKPLFTFIFILFSLNTFVLPVFSDRLSNLLHSKTLSSPVFVNSVFSNKLENKLSDKLPNKLLLKTSAVPKSAVPKKNHQGLPRQKKSSKVIATQTSTCTVELKIEGAIGAVSLNILDQAIRNVRQKKCSSLLLLLNTPGGQLITTRKLVDRILNVEFPVLCLVHPAGAHAGSAGAIILQACHVNGALQATNIGAATPILMHGKNVPSDLRKKVVNDTTSWLDSLTTLRNRNKKFGRDIVTQAKALSAKEAQKIGAIDWTGKTKETFLNFAKNKVVSVQGGIKKNVEVGDLIPQKLGLRYHVLSLLAAPDFVYMLFTGSLFLLYYEITHPGLGAPGILGVIGLIISFIGMHKLAFSYGGLILLLLSLVLFIAEVWTVGFGIFGLGGVLSFTLGSFLLFDPNQTGGVDISPILIICMSLIFATLMSGVAYLAWSSMKQKKTKSLSDDWLSEDTEPVEVTEVDKTAQAGYLFVNGENWRFRSKIPVKKGDRVKIKGYKGLVLEVQPLKKESC